MKIAVTYDNGQIFQHFGRTEEFKVYEIVDSKIASAEVISSEGQGHGALASLLAEKEIAVLICGGIGEGAQNALAEAGILLFSGAQGDADAAVEAFLKGELVNAGANCDHHHHDEEEGCGGDCGSGCGSGCGGCHGGQMEPIMEGENVLKTMRVHYKGTFNDGSVFDSSYDRGEPLEFICGIGQMIEGFDRAVANMKVGEEVDIHLMPEEAYGPSNPDAIATLQIAQLPGSEDLEVGMRVFLTNPMGQQFPVTVTAKDETTITLDANHEMAGKELNFHIEVVEIFG